MAGNDDGLREFVQARYVDLLRVAFLLTGSAHEAEDLVQAALVKMMRRWHTVDDPLAYARRIMVNQHISWWRRSRREVVTEVPPDRVVHDLAEGVVLREQLQAALQSLSPRTRAVVVLRYVVDLPEADVVAILGCSLGTVKSQASRGLAKLRDVLQRAEGIVLNVHR